MADATLPTPNVALGDWHVNAVPLPFRGRWCVIYTNSSTLLSVVTTGRSLKATLPQFRTRLPDVLERLELPIAWINEHRQAITEVAIAPTNDRRVLGSMNDFGLSLQVMAEDARSFEEFNLGAAEALLVQTPMSMLGYRAPGDAVRELAGDADSARPNNRLQGMDPPAIF